ncbi:MAG: hypothetical protein JXB85_06225 [Anaerolineales bacterium]|nr:hypothetical protein [Anaerolineales bacterium]
MKILYPAKKTNLLRRGCVIGILLVLIACAPADFTTEPIPTIPGETHTPQATSTQDPFPISEPGVVCTPPPCATDEIYSCPDECPAGCGTTCATMTPSPTSRLTRAEILPAGIAITDLWTTPSGDLWIASQIGIEAEGQDDFVQIYDQPVGNILGIDEGGVIWALGPEAETIHAFDGTGWVTYGPDQGWEPLVHAPPGENPVRDGQGNVWLATGQDDLRRLDPISGRWSSLTAVDIGFDPADENFQGHFLTDVALSSVGSIWVSDCIGMGEGFAGQGVRIFKDGAWSAIEATAGQCVHTLERDPQNRMWVGGTDVILIYNSTTGVWVAVEPPPWQRRQYITSLAFDPTGDPWVGTLLCGGASCDRMAYYFRHEERWLPLLEEGLDIWPAPGVAFDRTRVAWICWQGAIYRRTPETLEQVGSLQTGLCTIAADSRRTVWVAALNGDDAGLWFFSP